MSRVRPPSPAPVFCPPAWSAPDGHFPAGTLTYGAGARYPSGKGEVCKNPFDSIVLTALSSVFSCKIALRDPDSLLKSCSNLVQPLFPFASRGADLKAFSSPPPRRITSCISSLSRTGTDHSARPWEHCAEARTCGQSLRLAD